MLIILAWTALAYITMGAALVAVVNQGGLLRIRDVAPLSIIIVSWLLWPWVAWELVKAARE